MTTEDFVNLRAVMTPSPTRGWVKPAGPHNPLMAPGVCLCRECSQKVLESRCTVVSADGERCGDFKGHRGAHTILIATVFSIAEVRAVSLHE